MIRNILPKCQLTIRLFSEVEVSSVAVTPMSFWCETTEISCMSKDFSIDNFIEEEGGHV